MYRGYDFPKLVLLINVDMLEFRFFSIGYLLLYANDDLQLAYNKNITHKISGYRLCRKLE